MENDQVERAVAIFNKAGLDFLNDRSMGLKVGLKNGIGQSPIEKILYAALLANLTFQGEINWLRVQEPCGPYKIDMAVLFDFPEKQYKVAVECDGHDFHEKTEKQARHDKKKDRYLQSHGWLIARFTGSQIYNDPMQCVREIIDLAYSVEISSH